MTEVWRDIDGYEGKYQVSNKGRVKSLARQIPKTIRESTHLWNIPEKILKPFNNNGYKQVRLSDGKKPKDFKVHRLVATAFLPNDENYPQINHKDENKSNNDVDNLEWCSREYNMNYGTRKERAYSHKNYLKAMEKWSDTRSKAVKGTHLETGKIITFKSAWRASQEMGFQHSNIGRVCRGERKTHKGYTWEYI